mmetsp:Transcript_15693/g.15033  ORF Transcript_15693/g.15033 Transcript_15693/m.15033 type:complete len:336 (+) Transcript_15693:61-1068(+)
MARGNQLKRESDGGNQPEQPSKKAKTGPPNEKGGPVKGPVKGKKSFDKKSNVPRSLTDAVAKDKKEHPSKNAKKDGGDKKTFKKKTDGEKKKFNKEYKAPMTPAERRASKPNFSLVEGLKSAWNTIRQKSTAPAVRSKLVSQMATKMEGQVLQVTLRHDASRIVESILQYGTETQREKILTELTQKLVEIAKTPYGHFVVLKAITYCTGALEQKKIAAAFSGHFVSLGAHVIGARTVESILQMYAPKFTRGLRAEFYGKKFIVQAPETSRNLMHLLEQLPSKESALMDHMRDLVQKFVDKGLMEFSFVHNLLWEYSQQIIKESLVEKVSIVGKKK